MRFLLVPKSVTLNDLERLIGSYFFVISPNSCTIIVVKQLLGLPRFQNLLLIVYDHIELILCVMFSHKFSLFFFFFTLLLMLYLCMLYIFTFFFLYLMVNKVDY